MAVPTDRFYPDFVAMLQDGRSLVVEYKGEACAVLGVLTIAGDDHGALVRLASTSR